MSSRLASYTTIEDEFDLRAGQHIAASEIVTEQSEEFSVPCYGGNGIRGFVKTHNQTGPVLLIGRQGALCGNVQRALGSFYATEHAVVTRPSSRVDINWAFHLLTTMNLNQYATQSAQPGLAVGNLRGLQFRLPPLDEQRRIADVLDRVDALRAKRRGTLARLDELTESIFVDVFGAARVLEEKSVVDLLAKPLRNGRSSSTDGQQTERVLTLSAVTGHEFELTAARQATFRVVPQTARVVPGDLLICRGNGNRSLVGRAQIAPPAAKGLVFPDTMIAAAFDSEVVLPSYVAAFWNGREMRRQIERAAKTTNGTLKINQSAVEALRVPVPPLDSQVSFAGRLASVRTAHSRATAQLSALDDVFASLQQRAFRGDLFDGPLSTQLTSAA